MKQVLSRERVVESAPPGGAGMLGRGVVRGCQGDVKRVGLEMGIAVGGGVGQKNRKNVTVG
jgi:hypothetical protein